MAGSCKPVPRNDALHPLVDPSQFGLVFLDLGVRELLLLGLAVQLIYQPFALLHDLIVISVALQLKRSNHPSIVFFIDELHPPDENLSPTGHHLGFESEYLCEKGLRHWQHGGPLLDIDRAQLLQLPPQIHACARGLRGDLVRDRQPGLHAVGDGSNLPLARIRTVRAIMATNARMDPKMNGALGLIRCHRMPAMTLAGKALTPTAALYRPKAVPRFSDCGTRSATSALATPSVMA